MRAQSGFMRRESKPSTEIPYTFGVHKFYTVMNDNEQKELSYHRVQQMIKEQIDRIEHETGAQPEEDTRAHNDTECNILAVIKRLFRMRCLHFRKRRRRSGRND